MKNLFVFSLFCFVFSFSHELQAHKNSSNYSVEYSLGNFEKKLFYLDLQEGTRLYIDCNGDGGQVDYFLYGPNHKLIAYDMKLYSDCSIQVDIERDGRYFFDSKNYSKKSAKIVVAFSEKR